MLKKLADGVWVRGSKLPPEPELAKMFDVSIGTIRKAVDELVIEDILTRYQGRGTYISNHESQAHFFKFFRIARKDGLQSFPVSKVRFFEKIKPSEEVMEALQLGKNDMVFHFYNSLIINDDSVMIDEIFVPSSHFKGLNKEVLETRKDTLYNFYQNKFAINIVETKEKISLGQLESKHAQWLSAEEGKSILIIKRVAYTYNQVPIEFRISRVANEDYEYLVP